ncbi:MAG: PhoH family protein [Gammaproteobacteria bacterium]|nr:PhoH family protein [Gammaproteobacteria bacterium]
MMKLLLTPENNQRLNTLCGTHNKHLQQIEKSLEVTIANRGHCFVIKGPKNQTLKTSKLLQELYAMTSSQTNLTSEKIHLMLQGAKTSTPTAEHERIKIRTKKTIITPHSQNQINYIKNILKHDVIFSVGPAGTGKTFLAVACAVAALEKELVSRIVLVRPAVEAGERLGFLPGNIADKVDPYLRPLYDALYETVGTKQVEKLIAENVIEIAPLAFMRGRTLNSAFIILDESQNTTTEQMKMFLTRIGFGSKAVITGDITQIDLAKDKKSGLVHALQVLKNEPEISFNFFQSYDVVRHPLVQKIVEAYDKASSK